MQEEMSDLKTLTNNLSVSSQRLWEVLNANRDSIHRFDVNLNTFNRRVDALQRRVENLENYLNGVQNQLQQLQNQLQLLQNNLNVNGQH